MDETRTHWLNGTDAWCSHLGKLPSRINECQFIEIGLLLVALDEERRKRLDAIRKRMSDTRVPVAPILDRELPPDDEGIVTLCLAYRVDLTPAPATRESGIPAQDDVEIWRQAGRLEGYREMLMLLLQQRFGDALVQVEKASLDQLETWAKRVVSAATPDELFDG